MTLENLDKALASVIDQINNEVIKQAPEAVALAGHILQLQAQGSIDYPFALIWIPVILLVSAIICTIVSYASDYLDELPSVVGFIFYLTCIIATIWVAGLNINVHYNYALQEAAKDPKIAIARAILNKVQ